MSNLLLRKMTLKSKIGFGAYSSACVQDLINGKKHRDLISMYYELSKIDFTDEVKEYLKITPEREISKPGKNYELFQNNIDDILFDIFKKKPKKSTPLVSKNSEVEMRVFKIQCRIRDSVENSKSRNKNRVQGKIS